MKEIRKPVELKTRSFTVSDTVKKRFILGHFFFICTTHPFINHHVILPHRQGLQCTF